MGLRQQIFMTKYLFYLYFWFDKRKSPATVALNNLFGCILNVPNDWRLGWLSLPLNRKHWIAFKKIGDAWWNLDSKIKEPIILGNNSDFCSYIEDQLSDKNKELFLVITNSVQESGSWRADECRKDSEKSPGLFVELP